MQADDQDPDRWLDPQTFAVCFVIIGIVSLIWFFSPLFDPAVAP